MFLPAGIYFRNSDRILFFGISSFTLRFGVRTELVGSRVGISSLNLECFSFSSMLRYNLRKDLGGNLRAEITNGSRQIDPR